MLRSATATMALASATLVGACSRTLVAPPRNAASDMERRSDVSDSIAVDGGARGQDAFRLDALAGRDVDSADGTSSPELDHAVDPQPPCPRALSVSTESDLEAFARDPCEEMLEIHVNNTMLTSLAGLESVRRVTHHLLMSDNFMLTDLSGLRNLESVGRFELRRTAVRSLESLVALQSVESLFIKDNPYLESLRPLEGIEGPTVGVDLACGLYRDLSGLGHVEHLEYLTIINTSLTTLDPLALREVGGVALWGNASLTSIDALLSLEHWGESRPGWVIPFSVCGSPLLSEEQIDAVVEHIRAIGWMGHLDLDETPCPAVADCDLPGPP